MVPTDSQGGASSRSKEWALSRHKMKFSFVLVDDDQDVLDILRRQMEMEGHDVRVYSSSPRALEAIISEPPDCVVTDIMMPELDGVELTERLRERCALRKMKVVVLSGKIYETDKERALSAGADGFISKSRGNPEETLAAIVDLISQRTVLQFWGCRGTIPVPGPETVKFGGNTSCVSLSFPDQHIFIFDAGTGIKQLANQLVGSGRKKITGTIFISHPHWDHINFVPFFTPLFMPGNQFTFVGSPVQGLGIEQLVGNQMGGVHFPITAREFGAQVLYKDIGEGEFDIGPAKVKTMLLCHPGNCLGYAVYYGGKKICYVTDNELFPEDSDMYSANYLSRLIAFVQDADVLITDSTYFDEEYATKVGWGHSGISSVCDFAHRAKVKNLYLFHHDPDQNDEALQRKLGLCEQILATLGSSTTVHLAETQEQIVFTN